MPATYPCGGAVPSCYIHVQINLRLHIEVSVLYYVALRVLRMCVHEPIACCEYRPIAGPAQTKVMSKRMSTLGTVNVLP